MKTSGLVSTLLFASGSLAALGTEARRARNVEKLAVRSAGNRNSNLRFPAVDTDGSLTELANTSYAEYSTNWAGAVLIGTGYNSVTGTVTVPKPSIPSGGSSRTTYYASAWVGLDGDTCETAILQTGIDVGIQGTSYIYEAWYEWYPDYSYTFTGFAISAGDSIRMTVAATSKTAGKATIENLTTGKSTSHSFSSQTASLCETNAEWIVEDFQSGSSLVPFANFGEFVFTNAKATTTSGSTVGVSGATIIDIRQNSKILTDCGTSGTYEVYCDYTG
ncbi:putative aspergillopepsin [Ilyonectria destructans]|nr:putative aspergillopepsin [Ilyonectria destructans]